MQLCFTHLCFVHLSGAQVEVCLALQVTCAVGALAREFPVTCKEMHWKKRIDKKQGKCRDWGQLPVSREEMGIFLWVDYPVTAKYDLFPPFLKQLIGYSLFQNLDHYSPLCPFTQPSSLQFAGISVQVFHCPWCYLAVSDMQEPSLLQGLNEDCPCDI